MKLPWWLARADRGRGSGGRALADIGAEPCLPREAPAASPPGEHAAAGGSVRQHEGGGPAANRHGEGDRDQPRLVRTACSFRVLFFFTRVHVLETLIGP